MGAYTLAGELRKAGDDHTAAFANYEAALRPFVAEAQKMAQDSVEWFVPRSRLRLWFSRKLWSWMPKSTLKKLMIEQPARIANSVPLRSGLLPIGACMMTGSGGHRNECVRFVQNVHWSGRCAP